MENNILNWNSLVEIIVCTGIELMLMFLMLNSTNVMTMMTFGASMIAFGATLALVRTIVRNKNEF